MRAQRAAFPLIVLGVLSGCGFLSVPAVKQPAPPPAAAAAPAASPGAAAPPTVIVGPGDSVYLIARSSNTPIRAIIEANHLEPPYVLHVGQRLIVPHPQTYTVQMMDTLYGVARLNGVDASELVRANDLKPPYRLNVGQVLILPGKVASASAQVPAAAEAEAQHVELLPPQLAPPPPASAAPPAASPAVVASTTRGGGTITEVPLAPPAQGPASTGAESTAPLVVVPSPPPAPVPDYAAPAASETPAEAPAAPPPPTPPAGAKVASLPPAADEAAGPGGASGGHFLWPVHGKIVSGYGQKEGGLFNDGINIAVKQGTAVLAADAGVVVYAGNEIRGFGNLVLIKHANGWMTAYAHNEALLVHRGEEVRRGQAIARSGSSGTVATPQLHFEIRRGSHAVDPTKYLAALSS